jgi:peptidoglycan/LPS O-acetylase OafA/YrhL
MVFSDSSRARPDHKLPGLEVLRFAAALAVVLWHYQHFAFTADKSTALIKQQFPFYDLLEPFYEVGLFGVQLFWCISGYIFFWKYVTAIADRSVDGRTFFVFRLSRLYPLHLVTLLLVATAQLIYFRLNGTFFVYQDNDAKHLMLQLALASNWGLEQGDSFNGPIWSISIEVLIYVVFFLLLRFVSSSPLLNIAVIAACVAAPHAGVRSQICDCLAFFYVGGLAAMLRRRLARTAISSRAVNGAAWLLVAAMFLALLLLPVTPSAYTVLLGVLPMVVFCCAQPMQLSSAAQRAAEAAGNTTYASYLLHFPIQLATAIGFSAAGMPIPWQSPALLLAFLIATLAASYLTYRWFEAPAQVLIRHTLLRRRVGPALQG